MTPESLYKYCPPKNSKFIGQCSIRFSPLSAFNDPFDGLPDSQHVRQLPRFKAELDIARAKIAALGNREIARSVQAIVDRQITDAILLRTLEDLRSFRILCLSKCDPTTMGAALMMGYYCESHTGFAYEFSGTHPWVKAHQGVKDRTRELGPVEYRDQRPSVPRDSRQALFVKSTDWEHEEEFRLVRKIGESSNQLSGQFCDLATFPSEMLKSITLCCWTPLEIQREMFEQLASNSDLANVKVYKLSVHPDLYEFTKTEIPRPDGGPKRKPIHRKVKAGTSSKNPKHRS